VFWLPRGSTRNLSFSPRSPDRLCYTLNVLFSKADHSAVLVTGLRKGGVITPLCYTFHDVHRENFTFTCVLEREVRAGKRRLGMPRRRWRIILKRVLHKCHGRTWTGFIQLRRGTSDRLFWSQERISSFHTIAEYFLVRLLTSSENPSSMELVESSWNVMAHGDAREEKWRGDGLGSQYSSHYLGTWCIQHYYRWCVHLGCQQSTELTPLLIQMDSSVSPKDEIWFLRVCHHISIAV
jgi:hypothetical protein